MKVRCLIVDDEPVAREIISSFVAKIQNLELIDACKNASEALTILNRENVDLLFLDINMPDITGLSLAKSIHHKIKVIFTTAYREYAIDGFDLQAVDYLLKPISFDRFLKAVQRYFDIHVIQEPKKEDEKNEASSDFIFVRSDRKMVKIKFVEILYIESLSDYIKIYTKNAIIVTRETIRNIESKLPSNDFLRTHRSFIAFCSISIYSFVYELI